MAACTFFGHHDAPKDIGPIGNNGSFDFTVRKQLRKIKSVYNHIHYDVVYAYPPEPDAYFNFDSNIIYPLGLKNVPDKAAIPWRNKWMIDRADFVVVYVTKSTGGAAYYAEFALKHRKTVINIAKKIS